MLLRFFKYLSPLLVLLCSGNAFAQRYPFYNLNIEQGLIQSQATALAQDGIGHLWIGTLGGLSRYDGRSFTSYSVRDGLPSNAINTVQADKSGTIWAGTDKGLAAYDGRRFRQFIFQSAENPLGNNVTAVAPATGSDTVYCIAGRKLYAVQGGQVRSMAHPLPEAPVTAIHAADGGLYVALYHTDTLYCRKGNNWSTIPLPSSAKPYSVIHFFKDHSNQLWLVTTQGLILLKEQAVWYHPQSDAVALTTGLRDMAQAQDGSYWIGTGNGVIRMTDTSIRRYQKKNGLTDNAIFDVLNDAEGNIWMATDGQGLFRFSGAPFTALDESTGLPSAQIMSLADDGYGGLYLGTYDAGLFRYTRDKITPLPFPGKLLPNIVSLARDDADGLWIGTRAEGLWRYSGGQFRQYSAKDMGVSSNSLSALCMDKARQRLWIGLSDGAAVYEHGIFRELPIHTSVLDFLPMPDGSVLLATNSGLKRYRDELIVPYITGTAADEATPQCLALQGSYLWLGTSDNGLTGLDTASGKAISINKTNGLRSDFIYNLYAAPDGNLWAGTGNGIYSIRLEHGLPLVTSYSRGQGVTGTESNHNAVLGLPDGSIWFGTTNGAMHYHPGIRKVSVQPVSIVLQSVKVFGEPVTDSTYYRGVSPYYGVPQRLVLPYTYNNVTFTFQAITLIDEAGITYRYRMNGLESKWSEWAATNTITYSALPSGDYVLEVQCAARGSRTPLRTLRYAFRIATPFHKTALFRLLVFAGCILLGVSLQYAANRRKSARLKMIEDLRREEQNKVRERTAEDFHDEIGNKLTRINVLTNVLKGRLGTVSPDVERIIRQIQENTGQLYSGTRDILWSLKPSNDTLYEILHRIRDFGQDLFGDTEIDFSFTGTDERWQQYRLPLDASRNLIMIFKEAMNNALKYASPQKVTLHAFLNDRGVLHLTLQDDGKGFDPDTVKRGNGLVNMQTRAGRLNGALHLTTAPGKGTTLQLTFKIPQNRG